MEGSSLSGPWTGTVNSSGLYLEATRHSHPVVNKMGREPRQEGHGSISQQEHQRVGSVSLRD